MKARRAMLYMPGDDLHKIFKGLNSGVDSICMDLEDSVVMHNKDSARNNILEALLSMPKTKVEKLVRINPVKSNFVIDDLNTILKGNPNGVVLPKVKSHHEVEWVSDHIGKYEKINGMKHNSIYLLVIIETALGVLNMKKIAGTNPRLNGLIFGAEDLTSEIGAVRTSEATEVLYARSAVVLMAAAYNLQAIDMVFLNFKDTESLRKECIQGLHLGFTGKQIIHPNQIDTVQNVFTPSKEAIVDALNIIDAYKKHNAIGIGAFALEGRLVDTPVIKSAEGVLARARQAGVL